MATQCRAKNPNTCRVHGNSTITDLQALADKAAIAGNAEEYMNLRQQIDEAHELRNLLEEEVAPVDSMTEKEVEDAASAWFEYVGGGRKWLDESPNTRQEFRRDAALCLSAAEPHIEEGMVTPAAINAAARQVYVTTFGPDALDDESGFDSHSAPYYKEVAKTLLYAAKYGKL